MKGCTSAKYTFLREIHYLFQENEPKSSKGWGVSYIKIVNYKRSLKLAKIGLFSTIPGLIIK